MVGISEPRIRIFFIHRTLRQSGAARQIFLLYQSLDRNLFNPSFMVQTDRHVYYREMPEGERLTVLGKGLTGPVTGIRNLAALIVREQPAIIQSFNTDGNLMAFLATRTGAAPVLVASLRNSNKSQLEIMIERRISKAYERVVVNSSAIRDELITRAGIPEPRISLIPNGVDTGFFCPKAAEKKMALRRNQGIPDHTLVLLSVGRIVRQKNHLCTLKALALFRERTRGLIPFVWYCIGLHEDRSLHRRLLSLAAKSGLQSECRFIESVEDISTLYSMADYSILSSDWEGMPNAMLESMACGTLVVVADPADNDAIVKDGYNGFRFPANDPDALAGVLKILVEMPDERKLIIARMARATVLNHYSVKCMVERYAQLYQRIAQK